MLIENKRKLLQFSIFNIIFNIPPPWPSVQISVTLRETNKMAASVILFFITRRYKEEKEIHGVVLSQGRETIQKITSSHHRIITSSNPHIPASSNHPQLLRRQQYHLIRCREGKVGFFLMAVDGGDGIFYREPGREGKH